MGNNLVCCHWRWIQSPEITNRVERNDYKYQPNTDKYSNGSVNHVAKPENGYSIKYTNKIINDNDEKNHGVDKLIYVLPNQYSQPSIIPVTNFAGRGPLNATKTTFCYQNGGGHQQSMEASNRDSWMVKSTDQLQHISEREPEDVDNDPSINAKNPTLFLKRSKEDSELNLNGRRHESDYKFMSHGVRRWSSCSSVLLDDTTISQPNPALSLKTLALAIHLHVRVEVFDDRYRCSRDDVVYSIFDERRHPIVRQSGHTESNRGPSHREIYRFLRGIFNMAQLTPECAIVTLVYLERLLSSAEMEIMPWSWRRQLLASVLLASKVWDDQAVWNADYCQILKELCVEDVNELERCFLELIQFNINVPSSVYAHYYFDLLQLGRSHGLYNQAGNHRPLSWHRALRLEAVNCPPGPMDDYSARWWTRPKRPMVRGRSCDSINAGVCVPGHHRRVVIS